MLTIKRQFPINKVSATAAIYAVRQNVHRVITNLADRVKAARGHTITRNRLLGTLAVLLGFFGTYTLLSLVQEPVNHPIANVRPASPQSVGKESKAATQTASNQTTSDPKLQPSALWQPTSTPSAAYTQTTLATQPASSAPVVNQPVIVPAPLQQSAPSSTANTAGAATDPSTTAPTNGGTSTPPAPLPGASPAPTLLDATTKTLTDPLKPLLP